MVVREWRYAHRTHLVDQVIVELRDGSVEKYQVGAMATNDKQLPSGIMDAFVESIVTNIPPCISGEEGLKSLADGHSGCFRIIGFEKVVPLS